MLLSLAREVQGLFIDHCLAFLDYLGVSALKDSARGNMQHPVPILLLNVCCIIAFFAMPGFV